MIVLLNYEYNVYGLISQIKSLFAVDRDYTSLYGTILTHLLYASSTYILASYAFLITQSPPHSLFIDTFYSSIYLCYYEIFNDNLIFQFKKRHKIKLKSILKRQCKQHKSSDKHRQRKNCFCRAGIKTGLIFFASSIFLCCHCINELKIVSRFTEYAHKRRG